MAEACAAGKYATTVGQKTPSAKPKQQPPTPAPWTKKAPAKTAVPKAADIVDIVDIVAARTAKEKEAAELLRLEAQKAKVAVEEEAQKAASAATLRSKRKCRRRGYI